jgi:hypothetical protein
MDELLNSLPKEQKHAVTIVKTFIDCYNSRDGVGLFSGIARYNYLETRIKIAAVQARDLMQFWSFLRQKLNCPIPPKKADSIIMPLWDCDNKELVLKSLATNAAEIVMIARMLHDADKSEKKELWKELQAIDESKPVEHGNAEFPFDDKLPEKF